MLGCHTHKHTVSHASTFLTRVPLPSLTQVVEYVFETIRALNPVVANVPPVLAEAVGHVVGMFPTPEFSAETVSSL